MSGHFLEPRIRVRISFITNQNSMPWKATSLIGPESIVCTGGMDSIGWMIPDLCIPIGTECTAL